jgi:hypothetical protein
LQCMLQGMTDVDVVVDDGDDGDDAAETILY